MLVQAFNPCAGARDKQIFELETSLVYRVSYRTARATQKPCLGEQTELLYLV